MKLSLLLRSVPLALTLFAVASLPSAHAGSVTSSSNPKLVGAGTVMAFLGPGAQRKILPRSLTFAERVSYQRAIEEVYWRHRIWPKENPNPKPPLDAVMSQARLEEKVEDYLRNSQAVEDFYKEPLSAKQLQAEIERMAMQTKQPEVLRELFQALGNDPFVIAECLARPVLAERMITSSHVTQIKAEVSAAKVVAVAVANYTLPKISDTGNGCTDDTWTPTSTTNAPGGRDNQAAVWTGSEMIMWGGGDNNSSFGTGGRYSPSTDSWTLVSTVNAPDDRISPTAIWTGTEMIVWGGLKFYPIAYLNSGGRYNPSADSWVATTISGAPDERSAHTGVWTGNEMIVWGGHNDRSNALTTGGRYNPNTDSWTDTSTTNAPSARSHHTAVWTDSEMIVWGGTDLFNAFNTGGRYNPNTDTWLATTVTNAPARREDHAAVWSGTEMIVWSGTSSEGLLNSGGRYDPFTDSWVATSTINVPAARVLVHNTAIWTGREMIIWGGFDGTNYFNTGGRYNPTIDSWVATTTTDGPAGRLLFTAVWTGSEMIVWGGVFVDTSGAHFLNTGGRYCAEAELKLASSLSRKTDRHNSFDVPLPGVENRSDNKRFTIGFTFNNNVTGADSMSTSCGTIGSISVDPADSHTLLVTFNGRTCNKQNVIVTLSDVHDDQGNTLASAETTVGLLIGDVDGDGHVGNGDIGNIQGHLGEITDDTNFRDDINADGHINNQDVQLARAHRQESLQ